MVNSVVLVVNEILAKFELAFADFQGLDASLKSRGWNPKLCCRPYRSGNPAPRGGQRCLDDLPLAEHLTLGNLTLAEWRLFHGRCRRNALFRKLQFVDRKNFT